MCSSKLWQMHTGVWPALPPRYNLVPPRPLCGPRVPPPPALGSSWCVLCPQSCVFSTEPDEWKLRQIGPAAFTRGWFWKSVTAVCFGSQSPFVTEWKEHRGMRVPGLVCSFTSWRTGEQPVPALSDLHWYKVIFTSAQRLACEPALLFPFRGELLVWVVCVWLCEKRPSSFPDCTFVYSQLVRVPFL